MASPAVAWGVLTDYDRIGSFVDAMRSSASERLPDGDLLVHQTACVGFFPIRKTVRVDLAVHEDVGHRIVFRDELGKDFRRYDGEWRVARDSGVTHVFYRLDAAPRTFVPIAGRGMMSHSVRELLEQVSAEMQRRAANPHEADEHASPAAHGRCEDARPHAEGPAAVPVGGSSPTSDPPQHD